MSKAKTRRGAQIKSVNELLRQEVVYFGERPLPLNFIRHWQLDFVLRMLMAGKLCYAMPIEPKSRRFPDADIIHIERRFRWKATIENRAAIIDILNEWDRGVGDADDVIDEWEDSPCY